jgi:hypothetical protein
LQPESPVQLPLPLPQPTWYAAVLAGPPISNQIILNGFGCFVILVGVLFSATGIQLITIIQFAQITNGLLLPYHCRRITLADEQIQITRGL